MSFTELFHSSDLGTQMMLPNNWYADERGNRQAEEDENDNVISEYYICPPPPLFDRFSSGSRIVHPALCFISGCCCHEEVGHCQVNAPPPLLDNSIYVSSDDSSASQHKFKPLSFYNERALMALEDPLAPRWTDAERCNIM